MDTELLKAVEATASRNEKIELLHGCDSTTQKFLRYALDPYTTYGVTLDQAVVMARFGPLDGEEMLWGGRSRKAPVFSPGQRRTWWTKFAALLEELAARKLTGHNAVARLSDHFTAAPSLEDADWALRVLHKDLACGVSVKTLCKVFPGLVIPFDVMLAFPYDPGSHDLSGNGYVEPKFDGLRMTVVDEVPYTRNGNVVNGVGHVMRELTSTFRVHNSNLKDWVVDGECIGKDGISFEKTISAARTVKGNVENLGLVYHVFDLVRRDEWFSRKTRPFYARRRNVDGYVANGPAVKRVMSYKVTNPSFEQLLQYRDKFLAEGYEGAMWKSSASPYQFKRTDAVLKFKEFETIDGVIIDTEEGTGKRAGKLGSLRVRLEDGCEVSVGSGFKDDNLDLEYWRHKVGRMIEVKFQNRTGKGSLRFPVYTRLRPDKEVGSGPRKRGK